MARDIFISPNCCNDVKENNTVFLRHSYNELYNEEKGQTNVKPQWYCSVFDLKNHTQSRRKVKYCPHCSKRLPKIKRRITNKPICNTSDGGFYCDTCKERLINCQCYPPEYAWQSVK